MNKNLKNYEIEQIVNSFRSPDSLLNTTDSSKKLPIKILWKIDGNFRKLEEIEKRIEEKRITIQNDFATDEKSEEYTQEDGNVIRKVKDAYLNDFRNQLEELAQIDNEVDIAMISLEDIENFDMVPADFTSIRFMIEE